MRPWVKPFRYWILLPALAIAILFVVLAGGPIRRAFFAEPPKAETSRNAFAPHKDDVPPELGTAFARGTLMFTTEWIPFNKRNVRFDGLGPVFNQTSCIGCHVNGGRGHPPEPGEQMDAMIVALSLPGATTDGKPRPHPTYGSQLNDKAIPGVPAEGRVILSYEEVPGAYGDGTAYGLLRPHSQFADLSFGPLDGVLTSARLAQPVIGLGLLESVPVSDLKALADPQDANGDGISGRINWIVGRDGQRIAGRFGWKANSPALDDQAASAGWNDMGLTSSLRPNPNCPPVQTACQAAAVRRHLDMSDRFFGPLVTYMRMSTVPVQRDVEAPQVIRGSELFSAFGCDQCHVRSLETDADAPLAQLRNREVPAFTDLLLHDMGYGLADFRPDNSASGSEWRTAPLWGIGLTAELSARARYLHDGRARSLAEAILWHGGEAFTAREAFRTSSATDRANLVAFLNSL